MKKVKRTKAKGKKKGREMQEELEMEINSKIMYSTCINKWGGGGKAKGGALTIAPPPSWTL